MDTQIEQYLCRYCGKVIPGEVSSRPCGPSPDSQHRRGERWMPPGDVTVTSPLSPYDTGARLEPRRWREDPSRPEDYGKVDFENDESATVATVHIEATATGYRLVVDSPYEFEFVQQ